METTSGRTVVLLVGPEVYFSKKDKQECEFLIKPSTQKDQIILGKPFMK
jgi:hypothetical protein